jgi:hypothetical protein
VGGRWLSVHEEWTVIKGDEEVKESYDYGDTPNEQSAYLRLASSAFDILEKTKSSSVDLVYYDRFSPINPKTQSRVLTEMTATMKVFWWRSELEGAFLWWGDYGDEGWEV